MKYMKKLVLASLALLAVMMVILPLVGCDTNAGSSSTLNTGTTGGNTGDNGNGSDNTGNNGGNTGSSSDTGDSGNGGDVSDILQDRDGDGFYEIGTADELYAFAAKVNTKGGFIHAVLTADIVVNENVLDEDGNLSSSSSDFRVWTPIGNEDKPYTGYFNGAGHTISGLYFNDDTQDYVGLFGNCDAWNSAVWIYDVGIEDSYFCGKDYVGGVAGSLYGKIERCYNTGTVSGSERVGGVVGDGRYGGTLIDCYNTGNIAGSKYVGGVVGCDYLSQRGERLSNCYNIGTVFGTNSVGGVSGYSHVLRNVKYCYYLENEIENNGAGTVATKDKFTNVYEVLSGLNYRIDMDSEDEPWEYIERNPAPTLKVFNKK